MPCRGLGDVSDALHLCPRRVTELGNECSICGGREGVFTLCVITAQTLMLRTEKEAQTSLIHSVIHVHAADCNYLHIAELCFSHQPLSVFNSISRLY